jgi:hypothetical protein
MVECWPVKPSYWQKAGEFAFMHALARIQNTNTSDVVCFRFHSVKLFTLSISSQVNQFTDNTSRFVLLALVVTAVLQVLSN